MKEFIMVGMVLTALMAGGAFAADKKTTKSNKKSTTQVTPEQRQEMATMHEKMATCLRSDKPIEECRSEMRKNCQQAMGKDGCPGMGRGMGGMMYSE